MDEGIIVLSPFEVSTSRDVGYQAVDTLAGNRLRMELRDVANAISVINEEFLSDTGATDSQSLLVYTVGTEVSGVQGNFAGTGDSSQARESTANRVTPQNNTRVRGLAAADNVRNFFQTDIPWDGYNVARVEIQRGANSILFGIGSPAGIVNTSLVEPVFDNMGKFEVRFDENGSLRLVGDYNAVVIDGELAVRVIGLSNKEKYQQKPAFKDDQRVFASARWEPKFLQIGSSRTIIKANYESGQIDSNYPRTLPPIDRITAWFDPANESLYKMTYSAQDIVETSWPTAVDANGDEYSVATLPAGWGAARSQLDYLQADGTLVKVDNPNFSPWLGRMGDIFGGPIYIYDDPNSAALSKSSIGELFSLNRVPRGTSEPWWTLWGITTYDTYAKNVGLTGNEIGAYKEKSLSDPDIYDFYHNLLDGNTKSEYNNWDSFNASIAQSFLDDRLGFELAYDIQELSRGATETLSGNGAAITVDILETLPDGSTNPNVGRPVVATRGGYSYEQHSQRETYRATAFGVLNFADFMDEDSLITQILGKHTFTGLYQYNTYDRTQYNWERFSSTNDYIGGANSSVNQADRQVGLISYLGPSMLGLDSATDAEISRIKAAREPDDATAYAWSWTVADSSLPVTDTDRYVGFVPVDLPIWNASDIGERRYLYTGARIERDTIESTAAIWTGSFWNNKIIPNVGWRKDVNKYYNSGNPPFLLNADGDPYGSVDIYDESWVLPTEPENEATGESLTWGLVVHSPDFINEMLPWGTQFSVYYGESENFQPGASRVDIFKNPIASPKGETQEYGFTVATFDNRLMMKVNWYKTSISDATIDNSALPNNYMLGFGEAWAYQFAIRALAAYKFNTPVESFRTDFYEGDEVDPGDTLYMPYELTASQSTDNIQAAVDTMLEQINTLLSNTAPQELQDAWGFDLAGWSGGKLITNASDLDNMSPEQQAAFLDSIESGISIGGLQGNLAVVADTESKGIEFEITAQILDNWNLTINASKTTASRQNLAKNYADWVESRIDFYNGIAGDVRLWGGYNVPPNGTNESLRYKWKNEFFGGYQLFRLLEGSDVPELRPWRFNMITNYTFREGTLDGVNVGGAMRWQDEQTIGFPVTTNELGESIYDVDNPFKGDAEMDFDLWVGYERQLTDNIRWRIQLNVRNAFASNELIPVTVQADGSPAAYRIKEGMSWYLTNTFNF